MTSVVLTLRPVRVCVLNDPVVLPLGQSGPVGEDGSRPPPPSRLGAAEACLQVHVVTGQLGSLHITPRHSTSSSSPPTHPPIHLCPLPPICAPPPPPRHPSFPLPQGALCSVYSEVFLSLPSICFFYFYFSLCLRRDGGVVHMNSAPSSFSLPPPSSPSSIIFSRNNV